MLRSIVSYAPSLNSCGAIAEQIEHLPLQLSIATFDLLGAK
jgi:hypothetical protein